ncbi:hypothetical protein FJD38_14915 [Pseudomonas saxonica]|uniref:DUF2971 domain-containing protein n=1 Tax=Pseudomonas saxonica TaxID=2600598 RepID=A0ABY3GG76_9PSED|nr:hypothetical protein [Pseudomonas saxonica]TWR88695.1 hypothetical protein FJD38_14915 [Pseudomonas saxonica]
MGKISVGVDRDLVVKRYMSLGKFESLINSGSLYFSRFDRFTDKLEGGISSQNYPDVSVSAELFDLTINYRASDPASPEKTQAEKRINEINNETFEGIFGSEKKLDGDSYLQLVSSWLYANCWTDLDHECDAMWSLYGITGVGCNHVECCPQCESTHGMSVCIETTIGAILDNLELDERYNLSIQKVDYIDHKKIKFEAHELSTKPFFSKARHFSYENEVRLMLWPDRSDISFSYVYQQSTVNDKKSVELKIKNMSSFINKIILSPIPAKKSAQLRTTHYEAHQSNLGLKDSLANCILREKVQTLCSANSLFVEILDSDLNQVVTSDCYTFMDDFK